MKSCLRCWCEVNFSALNHNLKMIRQYIGAKTRIMGLVKANGYGHGMIPLAKFLEKSDCQELGCAHVHEGKVLREAGIQLPILLLSGFLEEELPEIIKNKLTLTLSSLEELRMVEKAAQQLRLRALAQVKIDTGMGRLGAPPMEARRLIQKVLESKNMELRGIFTHYACADCDGKFTQNQWKIFKQYRPRSFRFHSCNSAAIFALPQAHEHCVRPGLALYGLAPLPRLQKLLRPILSWKSKVTFIKTVPKNTPLSYGATYRTPRRMNIATVAAGYGDGIFCALSNRGYVLIRGRRCKILGRVTMDQILVDVSHLRRVRRGDEVILLGKQGKKTLLASDMARWAKTIPYEILTSITERVPRLYC
ncbi:MAG: alanine racemase [Verrucomicrobiota bacterium]